MKQIGNNTVRSKVVRFKLVQVMSKPAFFALLGIIVIVIAYLECMASQLPTAPPSQRKAPPAVVLRSIYQPGAWRQEFGRPRDPNTYIPAPASYNLTMHRHIRALAPR